MTLNYASLPNSIEAERSVLGSCLLSSDALGTALEILKPDDFFNVSFKTLFEVLSSMYFANKKVDFLTVTEELKSRNILEPIGGEMFLAGLMSSVTITANIITHSEIVREYAVRRRLIYAGDRIMSLAQKRDNTIKSVVDEALRLIFDAAQNRSSSDFRHIREIIAPVFIGIEERYRDNDNRVAGYSTGFTDLDSFTGGLQPGSFTIIAARPSMGKTAFAVNIAQFGGVEANRPVLIFSLEMPAEQLVLRMLSAESCVNLSAMSSGTFDTNGLKEVQRACDVLAKRNIYINDDSGLTAMDFRTHCTRFKAKHPDLALIIVDYLQLMSSGEGRTEGRQQEVSDISRMLKVSARELECPVIALSQLSRAVESRTEKKPQLSDLRDSGAIEQDADLVLLMYREDYYGENENNDLQDSVAEIRVAKNRNGRTGVFKLTFKREFTRFLNHAEDI